MIATGHTVTWHELPLDRRFTRRIVTREEFHRVLVPGRVREVLDALMPDTAPIAQALMGHVPGDVVTVETGFGRKTITVEGVRT